MSTMNEKRLLRGIAIAGIAASGFSLLASIVTGHEISDTLIWLCCIMTCLGFLSSEKKSGQKGSGTQQH